MDHVAIMKREWRFIEKILTGQKTIESRWYATKYRPWDAIKKGDIVYFKDSGAPVTARARVKEVKQFSGLNSKKVKEILQKYGTKIGIEKRDAAGFYREQRGKKYCVLIFLQNPKPVAPFGISKKGFGILASWVSIENINTIIV